MKMKLTKTAQREQQRIIQILQNKLAEIKREQNNLEIDLETIGLSYELAMGLDTCAIKTNTIIDILEELQ